MTDAPNDATPGFFPTTDGLPTLPINSPTTASSIAQTPATPGVSALAAPQQGQPQQEQPQQGQPRQEQPQQNPPSTPSGGATLGSIARLKSPYAQKMAKSVQASLQANPQAASQPGGWARALVGGAIDALGSGLGDAAAVGTVPSGGGALTGIARTLAARNQRLTAQKQQQFENAQEVDKNKAINAEANARKVYQQQATHNLREEGVNASLKSGQEQLAAWKNQSNPAVEKVKGLTSDQAKDLLKKDGLNPTEETMIPTGSFITEDGDGNPYTQLTYSVVRIVPVDLNPKNDHDKKILDRLNKYIPPELKEKWQGQKDGTIHFEGSQYNMLMQMAAERETADIAAKKAANQVGMAEEDLKRDEEALNFKKDLRTDPNLMRVLSQSTSVNGVPDFISARNALMQANLDPNSPLHGRYGNIDNDMREYLRYQENPKTGERTYVWDKLVQDYQKRVDAGISQISDLTKELNTSDGEKAASIAAGLQAKINDPNTPAPLKTQYVRMRNQANAQANASLTYNEQKKARETAAEQQAETGDMSGIMDMVKNYDYDPDKLFSRFKDMKAKRDFISQMYAETGQKWSDSEYKARYKTKQDYRPEGKGGTAVQSLNTFALHTGDANSLITKLNNTNSPLLNTPLNKWKESVLGEPQVIQYRTAIAAAADNYLNYLLNNKAKHQSDDDLAAKLQSVDTSPAMAQGIMRQMAITIAAKAREQNRSYKSQMGKDIPNFLDPDTEQVLRTFGIDPKSITTESSSGLGGGPQPGQQAPAVPKGATITYKDKQGNVRGWAVNGKFVSAPVLTQGQQ